VQAAIHKGSLIEITDDHLGCESIRVIPLREGQGIVKGCIYVGNPSGDIPVELQARQCIRSLIRRVDHLVRIQDPTGKYMFFRAIESGNLIDVEVHGKTPFDFFEPNVACKMVEHVERVRVSGRDLTETSEVGWKGEIFHFLDRIFPLRDIAGKLIGVVTISKKISGSKRAGVPPRLLKADAGSLSPREREVLELIARGFICRMIAEKLGISPKTVQTHRARIMQKLDLHKSSDLTRYAIEAGLL
jgi:DNA-binding CsgD family transcriptional regulator